MGSAEALPTAVVEWGEANRRRFVTRLRRWYSHHKRHFPWREKRDPYRVFVAEFMLQRTGASQVLAVYEGFLDAYPTLQDLLQATEDDLRTRLAPLGRTDRYKVLIRALRQIAETCGGQLPRSLDRLLELPGVGPYTARAILCFGHGRRLGLIDPNVVRVYSRVLGVTFGARPHMDRAAWAIADWMLPQRRVQDFNYALLDFAAAVCRIRRPQCTECPMVDLCRFAEEGAA